MRPEHLEHRPGKGLVIVHRCVRCGHRRANRIARDTVQADDIDAIAELLSAPGPAGPRGQPRWTTVEPPFTQLNR